MKLGTSLLLLAIPCLLSAAAACTTTKIVEEYEQPGEKQPGGGTKPGETPAAPQDGALDDLAADWNKKAGNYLDGRVQGWIASPPQVGQNVDCAMTCHTGFPTSFAAFSIGRANLPVVDELRTTFE